MIGRRVLTIGLTASGLAASALAATGAGSAWTASAAPAASTWKIISTPGLGGEFSGLDQVSCTARSSCFAVGDVGSPPNHGTAVAEEWNGTKWTVQSTPNSGDNVFNGINCLTASDCIAVGWSQTSISNPELPLAEMWNGTKWVEQTSAVPSGDEFSQLVSVSCQSSNACTAVGYWATKTSNMMTLIERWNGSSWSIQSSPNPAGKGAELTGVSCPTATSCMATGDYTASSGATLSFSESWNGSSWVIKQTVNPGSNASSFIKLPSVACTASAACTAVGFDTNGSSTVSLAELWNGTSWTQQATDNPKGDSVFFLWVSCPTAGACTATGGLNNGTLAEQQSSGTWTIQTTPNPSGTSFLNGVSCLTGTGGCMAVGQTNKSLGSATLAEQR